MFFSNLESILEIKLKNFIISFFDISFNILYIYIYIPRLKKSNEQFNLLFNMYVMQIINQEIYDNGKKSYEQHYKKNDKTIFFFNSLQNLRTKIIFYLKIIMHNVQICN